MKTKKDHCRNISEVQQKNRRKRQKSIPLTHKMHEHSLSLLDTDTAINSGGFKLGIWVQTQNKIHYLHIYKFHR